jgi:EAL domain-containing protein (putative c-di-GMP-specific phosphodiesterase class I)
MKSMISLGHRLRLKVLAEGVETKEQLAFLRKCKCDEIQGYYFGKPMSPGMFVKALVAGHKK